MSPKANSRLAGEFADRVCALCAAELRVRCDEAGMSPYRLCKACGVSRDMLSRILAGKSCPGLHVMARISYGLGMRDAAFLRMLERMGGGDQEAVKKLPE